MRIKARKTAWVVAGVTIVSIVIISLRFTSPQPAAAPPFRVVATGPVVALPPPRSTLNTNLRFELRPMAALMPRVSGITEGLDSQRFISSRAQRRVDLIDLRYQPEIKLDDLE